ncbi:MAG: IMP dehydrogenase, partial [Chryseobacterium taeanense]
MRIENDIKLGFKDVMFRPKRSTLKSRSEVDLEREFTFRHTGKKWSGVPVIAANMDTVGTFEMALELAKEKIITAIHKHYTPEEWSQFLDSQPESIYQYIALSTGTGKSDEEKIRTILE